MRGGRTAVRRLLVGARRPAAVREHFDHDVIFDLDTRVSRPYNHDEIFVIRLLNGAFLSAVCFRILSSLVDPYE